MTRTLVFLAVLGLGAAALAQAPAPAPAQAPAAQKTLAASIGVQAFPAKGQNPEQQSQDEAACYNWAVQNVGTDPYALAKQADAAKQQADAAKQQAAAASKGAGAKGAVRGAAGGALIGEIASNDAGKGAAYGAAAGMVVGRSRARRAQAQTAAAADQQVAQVEQATQEQMGAFKKAFSACLEGKGYIAKY